MKNINQKIEKFLRILEDKRGYYLYDDALEMDDESAFFDGYFILSKYSLSLFVKDIRNDVIDIIEKYTREGGRLTNSSKDLDVFEEYLKINLIKRFFLKKIINAYVESPLYVVERVKEVLVDFLNIKISQKDLEILSQGGKTEYKRIEAKTVLLEEEGHFTEKGKEKLITDFLKKYENQINEVIEEKEKEILENIKSHQFDDEIREGVVVEATGYVAELTGFHPRYVFKRKFLTPFAEKEGIKKYELKEGVYEIKNFNKTKYIKIKYNTLFGITKDDVVEELL